MIKIDEQLCSTVDMNNKRVLDRMQGHREGGLELDCR